MMPDDLRRWALGFSPWLALSAIGTIVLGLLTWQLLIIADVSRHLSALDEKTDRRVHALSSRFDDVLQQQSIIASQIGAAQAELSDLKGRLEHVAERLQATAVDPPSNPVPTNGLPERSPDLPRTTQGTSPEITTGSVPGSATWGSAPIPGHKRRRGN